MPVPHLTTNNILQLTPGGPDQYCYYRHVSYRLPTILKSLQFHETIHLITALLACILFSQLTSVNLTVVLSDFQLQPHSFTHFAVEVMISHISHVRVMLLDREWFYSGYWSAILSLHNINTWYYTGDYLNTHMLDNKAYRDLHVYVK